jgi:hypothetical protein
MFRETCRNLQFMHVVVFNKDQGLFALAREPISKKVHLFLISGAEEKIYKRDGRTSCWRPLDHEDLSYILQSVCHAVNSGLTVLKIEGTTESVINLNN